MQFFSQMTDDQVALIGCAVALFVTGTMMSLSYYIGQAKTRSAKPDATIKPRVRTNREAERRAA